jgi:hypothetical protein
MVAVPGVTPVTLPKASTIATVISPLLHVPNGVASDKVIPADVQVMVPPIIGAGGAFTVIIVVTAHPVPAVNVIMVVPGVTPVTSPLDEIVATDGVLLLQVPEMELVSRIVSPWHTCDGPPMAGGNGFTVTAAVAEQPEGIV